MKKCSYCGTENSDEAQVCTYCFTVLPDAPTEPPEKKTGKGRFSFGKKGKQEKEEAPAEKKCPICGTVNSGTAKFCIACSSELPSEGEKTERVAKPVCPVCFTENEPGCVSCVSCGAALELSKTKTSGTKGGMKLAWIGAGIAAVALTVGGVSMILGNATTKVARAANQLGEAVTEQVSQMSNLNGFAENFTALHEGGEFTLILDVDTEDTEAAGTVNYDRSEKVLAGTVEYSSESDNVDGTVEFSVDNREIMLRLQGSQDIYGCDVDEYSKTKLAGLIPVSTETLENLFRKTKPTEEVEDRVGDAWKAFLDTVETDETNEREINGQWCNAYEICWDTDAAIGVVNSLFGWEGSVLNAASGVLKHLDPDFQIYVNEDDRIVQADFMVGTDKCVIDFADSGNPLSSCVLTSQASGGGPGVMSGYLVSDSEQIQLLIDWTDVLYLDCTYDDSSGAFTLDVDLLGIVWDLEGKVTSRNGSAIVEVSGWLPETGAVELRIGLDDLAEAPGMLSGSGKYEDLLEEKNWKRLYNELSN